MTLEALTQRGFNYKNAIEYIRNVCRQTYRLSETLDENINPDEAIERLEKIKKDVENIYDACNQMIYATCERLQNTDREGGIITHNPNIKH